MKQFPCKNWRYYFVSGLDIDPSSSRSLNMSPPQPHQFPIPMNVAMKSAQKVKI